MINILDILFFEDLHDGFFSLFCLTCLDHVHWWMWNNEAIENSLDYGKKSVENKKDSRGGFVSNHDE